MAADTGSSGFTEEQKAADAASKGIVIKRRLTAREDQLLSHPDHRRRGEAIIHAAFMSHVAAVADLGLS
jgi:hypothetical protein